MHKFIVTLYHFKKILENKIPNNSKLYELLVVIPRKKQIDLEQKGITNSKIKSFLNSKTTPLFETIEIETVNRCNGECAFCPVNRHDDTRKYTKMDKNVFENIIQQLKDLNYDGRLQIFSNNEPLLDKRIFDFVKYAKTELPNSHMSFFTNGTLLDDEKFYLLIPYCDTFCIDIYHNGDNVIPDNIKRIIEICNQKPELKNKVIISMINKKAIRNNRGGQSKNRMFTYKLKSSCLLPFKQLIIRPDGKISLCCNDPLGKYTLGDVTKQSLIEIWNSKEYQKIRENLYEKGRSSISLCKFCDNFGGTGTNTAKDYIFTVAQFKTKWEIIDKIIKEN